jgi:hypothetical protein
MENICEFCSYYLFDEKGCKMCNHILPFGTRLKGKSYKEIYEKDRLRIWCLKSEYQCWDEFKRYVKAVNGEKYVKVEYKKVDAYDNFFDDLCCKT